MEEPDRKPNDAPAAPPATPSAGHARGAPDATAAEVKAANQLSPEEQMARFEKELKENDWGHQPC